MSKQSIFASLQLALDKATDYARANGEDVFITYAQYGRHNARQFEFKYRLRSEIKGEPLNICYLCKPNGEKQQLTPTPSPFPKGEGEQIQKGGYNVH